MIWFFDFVQFHVRISRHLNIYIHFTFTYTHVNIYIYIFIYIYILYLHLHLYLQIDGAYSRSIERHFFAEFSKLPKLPKLPEYLDSGHLFRELPKFPKIPITRASDLTFLYPLCPSYLEYPNYQLPRVLFLRITQIP